MMDLLAPRDKFWAAEEAIKEGQMSSRHLCFEVANTRRFRGFD